MRPKFYVIRNISDHSELWSNHWGWVDGADHTADLFTEKDKETFNLPEGGEWYRWQ